MYKIYINETPLILAKLESRDSLPSSSPTRLVARYPGLPKMILNYCDLLEKNPNFEYVFLYTENLPQLVQDFLKNHKLIEAAGGLVYNTQNEILAIYRRGSWDLPKGKIDKGESIEAAAIREVQEETGVQQLTLGKPLLTTYHTYRLKSGKRVLKKTYWFEMQTKDLELTPQSEEDIEKAIWIKPKVFLDGRYPMYNTIRNVLEAV
ncbi:MAG: NUDIX hydrolase [Bacteroidota bacterium]